MVILYIGSFRLPNYDAAAARVLNIARSLREAGHSVSFISWGGVQREEDKDNRGVYYVDGFPYLVTDELPTAGMSTFEKLHNRMRRGNTTKRLLSGWPVRIDVIITYNNSLCRWLLSFCTDKGIKLINDITEWYAYNELKPIDWLGYSYNMFVLQKQVKNKIVISSYLDKFYRQTHNIVVPATCDASEEKWHENLVSAKAQVDLFSGVTLIYAGTPARKDLLHHVVNAVRRLADEGAAIRLLILGSTRNSYINQYASKLHSTSQHERIIFFGKVPQDIIPSFYQLSDFMILLRENNRKSNAGFPTKFSESFTSGTPVIANLTSDLGNYLKDGITGFVVQEPREESVYQILKERVLTLSRADIELMKQHVKDAARQLDYHTYVEPIGEFMANLQ